MALAASALSRTFNPLLRPACFGVVIVLGARENGPTDFEDGNSAFSGRMKKGQDRKSTQMPPNLPSLAVAVFRLAGHEMH